ncbi:hypothetical protein KOW79_010802 [Hemibagrus wyckioides]|uniref:Uncharacterized protein n=1 Tax=Hemibagrus wyckioides TaxID=337641 RepID=A0A9D3NRZ8_9TELE|nr:hypothetical protein KOW79_010802 [Hemibagrus wyckioides]
MTTSSWERISERQTANWHMTLSSSSLSHHRLVSSLQALPTEEGGEKTVWIFYRASGASYASEKELEDTGNQQHGEALYGVGCMASFTLRELGK